MKRIRFAIKTLGCKVNQYESQVLRENLFKLGHEESDAKTADVLIVNSCTVTGDADIKTRKLIRRLNKENPAARIFVTGCYVFFEDDIESLGGLPGVVKLVHNNDKDKLPLIIGAAPDHATQHIPLESGVSGFASHTRAFLKIQDGCDQDCAYCKVTLVRGPSRSRPENEILDELKRLTERGYREIVLTGICLGAWKGSGNRGLADLLGAIDGMLGDFRVRLSSIEPNYVDGRLLSIMESSSKICRHLHIPLQAGSDRILALMKRRYNTEGFRELVRAIRERLPLAGITMDVIAGFPGETDDDFDRTISFIKDIRPSRLHVFNYSDRKGTDAYAMKDKVEHGLSKKRVAKLINTGNALQREFIAAFVGKTVDVLVEHVEDGILSGYTGEYVQARLEGGLHKKGDIARVVADAIDQKEPVLKSFGSF